MFALNISEVILWIFVIFMALYLYMRLDNIQLTKKNGGRGARENICAS